MPTRTHTRSRKLDPTVATVSVWAGRHMLAAATPSTGSSTRRVRVARRSGHTPDTRTGCGRCNDAIAKLRFDRLHDAAITDPARAWCAAALASGTASRDLNEHEVRRAFEMEEPDETSRASFAVAYAAIAGMRESDALAA